LKLLAGQQEGHPVCKTLEWWGAGVVICLERGADLHTAQLMSLPLTVSCFSRILIGLPFWYRLTRVVPEKGPLNGCVLLSGTTRVSREPERLFVAAKFYCPHALADGNQRIRSREKTMEFSAVLPTLSPYQVITALERNKQTCASTAQCRVHISVTIYFSTDYNNIYQHLMPKSEIQTFHDKIECIPDIPHTSQCAGR